MSDETQVAKPEDTMLKLCIAQGYVPAGCRLPGVMVFHLVKKQDPCLGCNHDRSICGGRMKGEDWDED